jgi:hypothetical protein
LPFSLPTLLENRGLALAYINQVKAVAAANLIQYIPQVETSGASLADYSGNNRNGANSNLTLGAYAGPDGNPAPQYVPASSSFTNLYSASLAGAFNGQELSFMIWYKVASSGVWTDGAARALALLFNSGSNYFYLSKSSVNNQLVLDSRSGGTTKGVTVSGQSSTAWNCAIITVSKTNDRLRLYHNFAQQGADVTGLGTHTGSLASAQTVLGSFSSSSPSILWSGGLAHWALWSKELSALEVAALQPPL